MNDFHKFIFVLILTGLAALTAYTISLNYDITTEPSDAITNNYIELADGHWYNPVDKSCYTESYSQSFLVENLSACANTVK